MWETLYYIVTTLSTKDMTKFKYNWGPKVNQENKNGAIGSKIW